MKKRLFKYLIYAIGLPAIGFLSMAIVSPLTKGAHDGGFLGMFCGLLIGQIVFTIWLTSLKRLGVFIIGIGLACLTLFIAFWSMLTIIGTLCPTYEISCFSSKEESLLAVCFFIILLSISILFFELINLALRQNDKIDNLNT